MTITVAPARNEYTANAAQTIFNYTFKIFSITDLNVYITPSGQEANDSTDLTTAYTVTGLGDEDGGTIILSVGTTINDLVTIVSDIPSSRTTDYQNNGDFRPETVNNDFDRVVSIVKKIEDTSNRSLLLQQSQQDPKPLSLEAPESGLFLAWKNDLSGTENVGAPGSIIPEDVEGSVQGMIANTSLTAGQLIITKGYISSSDGGGATYIIKTTGQASSDGDVIDGLINVTLATGDVAIVQPINGQVDVRMSGMSETITTNQLNFIAVANFCRDNNLTLVGSGIFPCDDRATIAACAIDAGGNGITLDMSTVISPASSYLTIGDKDHTLLTTVTTGTLKTNQLTVADASGISNGDDLLISNQTDFSWSLFRSNYKAGEIIQVLSKSGNILTLTKPLYDSYGVSTNVYKFADNQGVGISGISVIPSGTEAVPSVRFQNLKGSDISAINTNNNSYANVQFANCYRTNGINIRGRSINTAVDQNDYSLRLVDCQDIELSKLDLVSARHAFTTSSTGNEHTIVNRNYRVTQSTMATTGLDKQPAVDAHGNAEHYYIHDNLIIGNVIVGGDNGHVYDNDMISTTDTGARMIYGVELKGLSFNIHDNKMAFTGTPADLARGMFFDFGGNSSDFGINTVNAGSLVIKDNECEAELDGVIAGNFARVFNRGSAVGHALVVKDNTFNVKSGSCLPFSIKNVSGTPIQLVREESNTFNNLQLQILGGSGQEFPTVKLLDGTSYAGGADKQLELQWCNRLTMSGQLFDNGIGNGIYIDMRDAAKTTAECYLSDVRVLNNLTGGTTGSSITDSGIFINAAKRVQVNACTFGTDDAAQVYTYRAQNIDTLAIGNNYTFGVGADSTSGITTTIPL